MMAVAMEMEQGSFAPTEIAVEMDPRLQWILARRSRGMRIEATASSEADEIPVIAKVTDADAWQATSEVRAGVTICSIESDDGRFIVTGRIPVTRIEAVRQLPFVKSLKAAQPLRPLLAASVQETNARSDLLPAPHFSNGGKGVVVGIIDYGCDFAHRNFITAVGRTRLLSIWHQGGQSAPQSALGYGREYSAAEIDAALTQPDPYSALGYGPERDTPASRGTHGTHVMDICAGNGAGSGVAGFAPNADLVFVDVSHADIPFSGPDVVGSSFGDSTRLLEAFHYIFGKAGTRPCVINVSLGTNGGPHDGSTLVEQGMDGMLASAPNRAITIAASNSFEDGIHTRGMLEQDGTIEIAWRIPPGDLSDNEFELWYAASDRISVELIKPSLQSLGIVSPGQNGMIVNGGGVKEVFVSNRLNEPNNGQNTIGIFLDRRASAGVWTVRLRGDAITSGAFHAWIERDNLSPSSFAPPHENSCTLGSISNGQFTLVVGSYDAHKPQRPISWFSSAGPTRDGRQKPEISAPGHGVMAAHSRTHTGVVSKSGTSMAAPAVAGIVALMLGEARARNLDLTISDIRDLVIASARRSPPAGDAWHDRYGNGRIDATAILADIIHRAGQGIALEASAAPASTVLKNKKKKTHSAARKLQIRGAKS